MACTEGKREKGGASSQGAYTRWRGQLRSPSLRPAGLESATLGLEERRIPLSLRIITTSRAQRCPFSCQATRISRNRRGSGDDSFSQWEALPRSPANRTSLVAATAPRRRAPRAAALRALQGCRWARCAGPRPRAVSGTAGWRGQPPLTRGR